MPRAEVDVRLGLPPLRLENRLLFFFHQAVTSHIKKGMAARNAIVALALLASGASAWNAGPARLHLTSMPQLRRGVSPLARRVATVGPKMQAKNAAEALKLLAEKQKSKARAAFDSRFESYEVTLTKPMGLIFEEISSAAKGIGVKGMDKVNTNEANKFALENTISLRDTLIAVDDLQGKKSSAIGLDFDEVHHLFWFKPPRNQDV